LKRPNSYSDHHLLWDTPLYCGIKNSYLEIKTKEITMYLVILLVIYGIKRAIEGPRIEEMSDLAKTLKNAKEYQWKH
jgi:hypothetical protein